MCISPVRHTALQDACKGTPTARMIGIVNLGAQGARIAVRPRCLEHCLRPDYHLAIF